MAWLNLDICEYHLFVQCEILVTFFHFCVLSFTICSMIRVIFVNLGDWLGLTFVWFIFLRLEGEEEEGKE